MPEVKDDEDRCGAPTVKSPNKLLLSLVIVDNKDDLIETSTAKSASRASKDTKNHSIVCVID